MTKKKDNSTLTEKILLRRAALSLLAGRGVITPCILETHGGTGELWARVYPHLMAGTVFEQDANKVRLLGMQRPTWAVYQADVEDSLQQGVGGHLDYDLFDVDPYGSPWETITPLFLRFLTRDVCCLVVNDGLRQSASNGTAWHIKALEAAVEQFGNDLFPQYLEVCRWLLNQLADQAGYSVAHFRGYYCGHNGMMTHYLVMLERKTPHAAGSELEQA